MEIKIKDKYGITLKTKGKYCDDNIEILVDESLTTPKLQDKKVTENGEVVADEGFDGLGKVTVEIAEKPGAVIKTTGTGVTVPNEGYVDTIYFNTNMDAAEVVGILSQLTYIQTPFAKNPVYPILFAADGNPVVFALTYNGIYEINVAVDIVNQVYERVFYFNESESDKGFKIDKYTIAKEVLSEYTGLSVGTENDKLTNLISITPFSEVDSLLEGEYDGTTLLVGNIGENGASAIPTSGFIKDIYLNTQMKHNDVVSVLKNLNYVMYDGNVIAPIVADASLNESVFVTKVTDDELLDIFIVWHLMNDGDDSILFVGVGAELTDEQVESTDIDGMNLGWQVTESKYSVNIESVLSDLAAQLAYQTKNEEISSVISATPFAEVPENTISIESLIKNGNLPLNINFSGSGAAKVTGDKMKLYFAEGDFKVDFAQLLTAEGGTGEFLVVDSLPEIGNISTMFDGTGNTFYPYYIPGDTLYVYCFVESTLMWVTAETMGLPFHGEVNSTDEMIEEGLYVYNTYESISISGDYDGKSISVAPISLYEGVEVPSSGYVEKVYLNTNLSESEVAKYISSVVGQVVALDGASIIGSDETKKNIVCMSILGITAIGGLILTDSSMDFDPLYFVSGPVESLGFKTTFTGWNPSFNGIVEFNSEASESVTIEYSVSNSTRTSTLTEFGIFNKYLTKLFSVEPFGIDPSSSVCTTNVARYIHQKKLPLEIKTYSELPITLLTGWAGFTIKSTEYFSDESIYLNNKLSVSEVEGYLKDLTYDNYFNDGRLIYVMMHVVDSNYGDEYFIAEKFDDGYAIHHIRNHSSLDDICLFNSSETNTTPGFIGWKPSFLGHSTWISAYAYTDKNDFPVAQENDKISPLFSLHPFVRVKSKISGGDYTNNDVVIDGRRNTYVPNSGYIDKVYLDTSMPIEDVMNELAKLTYDEIDGYNFIVQSESRTHDIIVNHFGFAAGIHNNNGLTYFQNSTIFGGDFTGWNPDFDGVIEIGENVNAKHGLENKLVNSLFSVDPWEKPINESTLIDVKSMIEKDKNIPNEIEVKFDIPVYDGSFEEL